MQYNILILTNLYFWKLSLNALSIELSNQNFAYLNILK